MRFLRRRRQREQDLDDEILSHLALEIEQRIADGETPADAERAARRAFGSVGLVKEVTRGMWGGGWRDALAQDLKYACRAIRKSPGFALVAMLTLALGIGANTAIFSVVDAALLRPLPFPDADRLVRISSTRNGVPLGGPSEMDLRDMASAARGFEGMIVYDRWRKNVSLGGSDSEETVVGLVPGSYFELLRIRPILGRVFTPDERVYGNHFVAAIGAGVWRTRLAADPQILGKTIRINGEPYTIVSVVPDVVPAWMDATSVPVSIWTPLASDTPLTEASRASRGDWSIGRLEPGVSYEQARAELTAIAERLSREHPIDRGIGVDIEPLSDARAGPVKPVLLMLSGAVAIVLLIACANLAGLLIARNSARSRELAVRAALGASRSRLLRQLLFETLVLSLAGGAAGLVLASGAGAALATIKSAEPLPYTTASNALPQFWSATLDLRGLAFTLGVSLVTAVLFGLAPAFTSSRVPLVDALKEGGRSGTAGAAKQRFRRLLIVTEVAFSLMLVFAASLLAQTMIRLHRQDPGFRTDHLLLAHVYVPPAWYPDSDAITRFCDAFRDRIRSVPGVQDASVTTGFPPSFPWRQMFTIPGLPAPRAEDVPITRFAAVDARYLPTLRLALLRGRDFADADTPTSPPVAVVNEEFVRRYFPNADPIGREIRPGPPPGLPAGRLQNFGALARTIRIVGVVRNFMDDGMAAPQAPLLLALFGQVPGNNFGFKDIIVRTSTTPESVVPAIARELRSLDADIPLGEIQTMDAHMSRQTADTRFITVLLGLFAALGTVLAVIGAYGVVAYLVAQRTQELGVRLALGAASTDILWLVLRYGLSLGLGGVVLGLGGALAVRQSFAGMLYGVAASDPATLTGAAALFLFVIGAASALPAVRAMRINPVEALRAE
jgi:putative ABC transport system permease protein